MKHNHQPLESLPYRFRYMNGMISRGGWKTFEGAVQAFFACKRDYGSLYCDLKDVVCIEREKDYLI